MTVTEVAEYVEHRLKFNRIQYQRYDAIDDTVTFRSAGYTLAVSVKPVVGHTLVICVGEGCVLPKTPPTFTAENADPCIGILMNYHNARVRQLTVLEVVVQTGTWTRTQVLGIPNEFIEELVGPEKLSTKNEMLATLCQNPSLLSSWCSRNGMVI